MSNIGCLEYKASEDRSRSKYT